MKHCMERWYNAVGQRFSVRRYRSDPSEEDMELLKKAADMLSVEDARIFIGQSDLVFRSKWLKYGKIKGTNTYAALIAKDKADWTAGSVGEAFVLECTALGLGTCWLGISYRKREINKLLPRGEGEKVRCLISIGVSNEAYAGRPRKPLDQLTGLNQNELITLPEWQQRALECGRLAPSAVNGQPWRFEVSGERITVRRESDNWGYGRLDCGIAMLHIELGAAHAGVAGEWEHGADRSAFTPYTGKKA